MGRQLGRDLPYEFLEGGGFYYLASPYTHRLPEVVEYRVGETFRCMSFLLSKRLVVFSPIWTCHKAAKHHTMPTDYAYWWTFNEAFMRKSTGMIILMIDGWEESKGVRAEIEYYNALLIPYYFFAPEDAPPLPELD